MLYKSEDQRLKLASIFSDQYLYHGILHNKAYSTLYIDLYDLYEHYEVLSHVTILRFKSIIELK